jgi:catechol 2,3-dioxygenase-like lactoylglutathione lyase family enzyme
MPEITRVLHVSIHTEGQLDASLAFYQQVLGLGQLPRPRLAVPGAWLSAGAVEVHLNSRRALSTEVDGPSPVHICFGVWDLEQAVAELRAANVAFVEGGSLDVRQIWLRDPAGNAIELQEDRS